MTAGSPPSGDIPMLLARAASSHPDRTALVVEADGRPTQRLTFGELQQATRQLAAWLAGRGVRSGSRVAVMLPNTEWWPLTWLACAELGAVIVPVNRQFRVADLRHQLLDSGSSLLVTDEQLAAEDLSPMTPTVVLPASRTQLRPPERPVRANAERSAALMSVQYTSGSTGPPKGCLLTQETWVGIAEQACRHDPGLRSGDVLLTAQPFSYIDPQWNLAAALLVGATLVLLDGFHPSTFMASVRRHRATVFYCLGAMPALLLAQEPSAADADNELRFVLCSGIPAPSHGALERRFGAPWFELYGSTEIGGAAIGVSAGEHDRCLGTGYLGRPLPGFDIMVVDPQGLPISNCYVVGELLVRSPNAMLGYWQANGAVLDPRAGGWFATGDLVSRQDEGFLRFEGRARDTVRRAGENISAEEVEQVLRGFPGVALAAVIPEDDDLRGEEVHAVIDASGTPDPEEMARYCAERIARFKVPRYWSFQSLPMTESGKVSKQRLRALLTHAPTSRYDRLAGAWTPMTMPRDGADD